MKRRLAALVCSVVVVAVAIADNVAYWPGIGMTSDVALKDTTVFMGITVPELKSMVDAGTHYLSSEMTGTAFDGGIAQSSDFWSAAHEADGSWIVQLQCVYKNDLRFVNVRLYDAVENGQSVIKATQIGQNWCSGSGAAFAGFVTNPTHTGSWNPTAAHYFVCSLGVTTIDDVEAEIGGKRYKTLNEAKKAAIEAGIGTAGNVVTLLRDKVLWTSSYVQDFALIIPQGVKFGLAADDVADYNDPDSKIFVKGTLDVRDGNHLTVGRNVLELYAGARVEGVGDNFGLMFVTNTKEIPIRDNPESANKDVLIDGDVTSNVDVMFNVESGVNLHITGGVNPSSTGHTVHNAGAGTMVVDGVIGGSYTVTKSKDLDVGLITAGTEYAVESFGGVITNSVGSRAGNVIQMGSLRMMDDTVVSGYPFGFVKPNFAVSVLDLGGKTLTVDMLSTTSGSEGWRTRNFYLANTSIKNGGELVVKKGDLVLYAKNSTMNSGTLRIKSGAMLNPNGLVFTLDNLVNEGGSFGTVGTIKVNGTISGNSTIANLVLGDGATIKLRGADVLTVSDGFRANGRINVDLSEYLIKDKSIDIAETPGVVIVLPTSYTTEMTQAVLDNVDVFVEPSIRTDCVLEAHGNKICIKAQSAKTLYWSAWRGTFWEHVGGTDANGNHGYARDADGNLQAIFQGDTIVFNRSNYMVDGQYAQTPYWHYDENLYIKNEVVPGRDNEWDLKVMEGVTLKLGLRGGRNDGQNIISKLKIYIEEGSRLELGYWGNTHHYQGVIRDDAVFGGLGEIVLGNDMGTSLRAEGDILVNDIDGVPTMNLMGKELVLCNKAGESRTEIAVALTGLGTLSAEFDGAHVVRPITFGNDATIDATQHLVNCDDAVSFGNTLTVKLSSAPMGTDKIKILNCGTATFNDTDVRVLVNGSPVASFYELVQEDDGVYVQVKTVKVNYGASAAEGYDFSGALVSVTMNPAIKDLPVTLTIKDSSGRVVSKEDGDWMSSMVVNPDGSGSAVVMAGNEDQLLERNQNYTYEVAVGEETMSGSFFVGNRWFLTSPAGTVGGTWDATPDVNGDAFAITDTCSFAVSLDKAENELAVIEQVVTFDSAIESEDLMSADVTAAKGAITIAQGMESDSWKGYVNGAWVTMTGVPATFGSYTIRIEYDRKTIPSRMRYLINGIAMTANVTDANGWFAADGGIDSISYIGTGMLSRLEGIVDDPALVIYDGAKYMTMESAVGAWKAAGCPAGKAIRLLTNVFFAPEPGAYRIDCNGFTLYLTNDMEIKHVSGTLVQVGFPEVVTGYTAGQDGCNIVIDGEWLGHAVPWKTRRNVRAALWETPEGSSFARWQSYLLGFAVDEVESASSIIRGIQTSDAEHLLINDGLVPLSANDTGVVVKRILLEGNDPASLGMAEEQPQYGDEGMPVDLPMLDKVKYVKIGYEFLEDVGQDADSE